MARGRAPGGDGGTPRPCPAPRSSSPRCCPTHSPASTSDKPREGGFLLGFIWLETPPEMGAARWARGAAGAPLRGSALGQTPQPSGSKIQQETSWHAGISLSKPHFFGEEHRQPLHHLFWPPQEQAPIPRCSPQPPLRTAPRPQRAHIPLCPPLNHPDGVVQGCPGGAALGTGSILCLTPAQGHHNPISEPPPPIQHPLLAVPEPGPRRFY